MLKQFFEQHYFIYAIGTIFMIGFLIKFILSIKYKMLIKASKKIGTSNNKLMKSLRIKFETCYKLKLGVNNVDTFVDKYIYNYKFCGLFLSTWHRISSEFAILCGITGCLVGFVGYLYKCGLNVSLSTTLWGLFTLILLISYDYLLNFSGKREMIKVNACDYLENYLKARFECGTFDEKLFEEYKNSYIGESIQRKKVKSSKNESNSKIGIRKKKKLNHSTNPTNKNGELLDDEKALRRREFKKKELKHMIEQDKINPSKRASLRAVNRENSNNLALERARQSINRELNGTLKERRIADIRKESIEVPENEIINVNSVEKKEEMLKQEEAKIIEDILKEFLA